MGQRMGHDWRSAPGNTSSACQVVVCLLRSPRWWVPNRLAQNSKRSGWARVGRQQVSRPLLTPLSRPSRLQALSEFLHPEEPGRLCAPTVSSVGRAGCTQIAPLLVRIRPNTILGSDSTEYWRNLHCSATELTLGRPGLLCALSITEGLDSALEGTIERGAKRGRAAS